MSEPVAHMLERLGELWHAHSANCPAKPSGYGDNEGKVRDGYTGQVIADCFGHEGRAQLFAALHNAAPRLLALVRAGEALAAVARAFVPDKGQRAGVSGSTFDNLRAALAAWDRDASRGAGQRGEGT